MSEPIKVVRGDSRPYIKLTLTKSDGTPLDVSDAGITITVHVRSVGSETLLQSVTATKVGSGSTGEVTFTFPATSPDVVPGIYEGEVEISFDGEKQTLYDRLKFFVREQIG